MAASAHFPIASLVTVAAPVRSDTIKPPYVVDPDKQPLLTGLNREKLAFDISDRLFHVSNILIFHGDADNIVPFENALEIYQAAKDPKKLIRQTNGDHPMSDAHHQKRFMRLAPEWFENGFGSPAR